MTVIPNWQADKYSSKWVITFLAAVAPFFSSKITWSIRDDRTLTMANSVATKKAVKAINTAINNNFIGIDNELSYGVRRTPPIKINE